MNNRPLYLSSLGTDLEIGLWEYLRQRTKDSELRHPMFHSTSPCPTDIVSGVLKEKDHLGHTVWDNIRSVNQLVNMSRFCLPHTVWPETVEDASRLMSEAPTSVSAWSARNLVWMAATGVVIYVLTEETAASSRIVSLATLSRVLGVRSVGILPTETQRIPVDLLTMTDVIVGDVDPELFLKSVVTLTRG